ncbi:hypothetical protein FHR70_001820 [Microvirga lupini]|uniref:Uncharacterized protein n=1 Tax=Microvirga lupini TaxID=420324 RepID=A0A7W4VL17_9HYPH|nr:hypothetical protein [Microvirga lupini]
MTSNLLSLSGVAPLVAALLWAGGVLAQVPDQAPDRAKHRQSTPQSVERKENEQTNVDAVQAAADRKFREMDRRLNRTLRSVCVGC